jgi:hypothetical protein
MEKRRRARINNCLNELKTLILDAMKKDVSMNESIYRIVSLHYWEFFIRVRNGALYGGCGFDLEPQRRLLKLLDNHFKISSGRRVGLFYGYLHLGLSL